MMNSALALMIGHPPFPTLRYTTLHAHDGGAAVALADEQRVDVILMVMSVHFTAGLGLKA